MTIKYDEIMNEKNDTLVNESHYKYGGIEPIDYIEANLLDFKRGNIVKYITRDRMKDKDNDIKKVINYAVMCLKYDYDYTHEQIAEYMKMKFIGTDK